MEWKFRRGLCEEREMKNMQLVRLRDVGRLLDVEFLALSGYCDSNLG